MVAKVSAIFLITIDVIIIICLSLSVAYMVTSGFYVETEEDVRDKLLENTLHSYAVEAMTRYRTGSDFGSYFGDKNFSFSIYDIDDIKVAGYGITIYSEPKVTYRASQYRLVGYIDEDMPNDDMIATISGLVSFAHSWRYVFIVLDIVAVIVFFALLVFLFFSAGYRGGRDTPSLSTFGKIPFDLLTFLFIALIYLEAFTIYHAVSLRYSNLFIPIAAVILVTDFVLFLLYIMNIATRIKLDNLISSTIIYRTTVWIIGVIKSALRGLRYIIAKLPVVWKTAALLALLFIAEYIVMSYSGFFSIPQIALIWLIKKVVLFLVIIFMAISLYNLQKGAKLIAEGNLDYHINTKHMYGDFRRFAEDLNSINDGMQKAVDEKMKSERLKTELITNVSHDIKTPLTSIINYVDLIKKEQIENKNVSEYVSVLDRQSTRLKKLIEDLIEASKASTGNLPVNFAPCDVSVLLDQAIAEYDDKLTEAGLELVMNQSAVHAVIMADGRHLWRIFDNLLNNVCKYAQPSTRVYIDVRADEGDAVITFRNISKSQLNISGEELMERFVRGDSSRNTEGSGLGLSIAKSLVELQNGSLELSIDGDLFKVSLNFKIMEGR